MPRLPVLPRRLPSVEVTPTAPATSATSTVLVVVAVVAALYFGRDVLIPLALAILVSFALSPIVTRLRRLGLPRPPAVIFVVLLFFAALGGFGTLVGMQVIHLAEDLPRYEHNLRAKVRELGQAAPGGGVLDRTTQVIEDIGSEIDKATAGEGEPAEAATDLTGQTDVVRPIPVEVHEPPPAPLQALRGFAGPLFGPLATAGLVFVFVIFILLQREDLRDRLIRLAGSSDVHRTTEAITDAARRISRYLLMQLLINIMVGVLAAIGLYFIGVPNPLLWGLLAAVLRFIPYVGPVFSSLLPIALALAVDPGWTKPLLTAVLFLVLELFSGNVLEPWLYGSSTGLSSVAIIVAAVFWTTLWGPIGLLLATPLTVCLVVLGTHVPQLRFFEVMLGTEPVLPPEVKFYQRLLAGDPVEASEVAEEFAEERSVGELYARLFLPALDFAERDRMRGALDRTVRRDMIEDLRQVLARFAVEPEAAGETAEGDAAAPAAPPGPVLCVGGRNGFDAIAAEMLVDLLARRGLAAVAVDTGAVTAGRMRDLPLRQAAALCLLYVNPAAVQHARRLVGRLRPLVPPGVPVIVGLLDAAQPAVGPTDGTAETVGADSLATTLTELVDRCAAAVEPAAEPAAVAEAVA